MTNKIIKYLSIIQIFLTMIYLFYSYDTLPDFIPMHYDIMGNIDRYGSKYELLILPFFQMIIFLLLQFVSKHPSYWNIPFQVAPKHQKQVEKYIEKMIQVLCLIVMIFFSIMLFCSLQFQPMNFYSFIILLGLIIYVLIDTLFKIRKIARENK